MTETSKTNTVTPRSRASAKITVSPLTPSIGAEVIGIDLAADLNVDALNVIRDALLTHHVIFFRQQRLGLNELARVARAFGPLHEHPTSAPIDGHPGIIKIHNDATSKVYAGRKWHSDVSCDRAPPMASILHLHQVPESGGDTLFANMYAAYEALSPPLKQFLDELEAVHESAHNYGNYFGARQEGSRDNAFPTATHPVVCRHPDTQRKLLFVNETFTTRIEGLEPNESAAVLDMLYRHINQPRFHCRFRWAAHSVAFWDNRCVQHHALWDYYPATRSGYRATIAGTPPTR